MKTINLRAITASLCLGVGVAHAELPDVFSPEVNLVDLANPANAPGGSILASFADATVTFTGHSAAFSNTFLVFGSDVFNNLTSTLGDFNVFSTTPGVNIDFSLRVDPDGIPGGDDYVLAGGSSFAKVLSIGTDQFIVGFEDTRTPDGWGGFVAGGDLDYNDMTVKFHVPEPSTYAMLFAGLGVIGFVASRRRPRS